MNYVIVDKETGESLERTVLRDTCLSFSTLNFTDPENNNLETGEPEEATENCISRRRIPFQIPRSLQRYDEEEEEGKRSKDVEERSLKIKRFMERGEPFGQTNPIMLFMPVVFYFRWVAVIVVVFEVFLHMWAHHKNKRLKNADVYFRSPLHSITSEFCALCQSETCMNRVGKLQEKRAHKFLRQCNYMKRVVS